MKKALFTLAALISTFLASHAQDSLARKELQKQMNQLYEEAARFKTSMPQLDITGLQGGISLRSMNVMSNAVPNVFLIHKTCDCAGNVVKIDTTSVKQSFPSTKPVLALNVEERFNKYWGIRLSAIKSQYTLDSTNSLVYSENNRQTTLRKPLNIHQIALQLSAKLYLLKGKLYIGGGTTWAYQTANKPLTNDFIKTTGETPPQYAAVLRDEKALKTGIWKSQFFIGFPFNTHFIPK